MQKLFSARRAAAIVATVAILGLVAVGLRWGYEKVFTAPEVWYVQVDNACVTDAPENNNDFDYHYELPAVSQTGETGTIGFDTSRVLRDGAYLKLETLALRGVRNWEEVAWDDIPAAAQAKL